MAIFEPEAKIVVVLAKDPTFTVYFAMGSNWELIGDDDGLMAGYRGRASSDIIVVVCTDFHVGGRKR